MADTQKIKIQIDGQEAELTVAAVTEEIANLRQQLDGLDEASSKFDELTARISELQKALAGVGVSLDTDAAVAGLDEVAASIESINKIEIEPIVVPVEADGQVAKDAIDSISIDPLNVDVNANLESAQSEIDSLSVDPIKVPVEVEDVGQIVVDQEVVLPVRVDLEEAQSEIDSLSVDPIKVPVEVEDVGQIVVDQEVVVPVQADVSDAQSTIDSLSSDDVTVKVDADVDPINDSISEVRDNLKDPVEVPVDVEKATASIQQLKADLKAAKDEIANSEVGSQAFINATQRAGELKERIQDIGKAIDQQKGEPIERLGSQFRGLGDSIVNLDFKKAGDQFKTFSQTIGQVDLKGLAGNAGQLSKTIGGGLVDAFKSLGRVIIANPLLLIATVVLGVGTALFKLKDSIKPVQIAFDAIGDAIGFVTDLLKSFSDAIGLTNFGETDAIEKTTKAYEEQSKVIETTTKQAIASAKARGASQEELLQIQLDGAEKIKKSIEPVVAAEANLLRSLQERKSAGRQLTEEQQDQYDKATENVNKLIDANNSLLQIQKEQADLARERANAEIAAEDQIAVLTATNEKQRLEAQKRQISNAASAAAEKARLEGKSEAEVTAILAKSLSDQSKLQEDFDKASIAKAKARRDAISAIEQKYDQDQRAKIAKTFDDDLKKLAENGVKEGKAIEAIQTAKLKALDDFDAAQRKKQDELAAKQIQLQQEIAIKTAEANKRLAAESVVDPEERARLEAEAEAQLTELRIQSIEANKQRQLAAIAETTAAQVEQAGLSEEQITEIVRNGELEQQKIILDSDAQVAKEKEDQAKRERDIVIKSTEEALDRVRAARESLANNAASNLGILGLQTNLGALQASIDEEAEILKKQRDANILSSIKAEEEYQAKLTSLQQEGLDTRRQLSADAIQSTVDQAGQLLSIVSDALSAQREGDQSRIDSERADLQAQYEQRKAFIEANIADETARAAALATLDRDFAASNQKLDKQQLELKKRAIRQERDVAIAQIALSTATAIAGVLAQGAISANPISFALILAAGLATVALTISKAQAALKQADAAAAKFGAGGGGGADIPIPSAGGGQAAPSQAPPNVPVFDPTGINNNQALQDQANQPPIVVNAQVSVLDINAAQNRVSVAETNASIG